MSLHAAMLTFTGRYINLAAPSPSDISALDLAHHLATTNRWCGAAERPMSVAEHSLLVVEILERELGIRDPAVLLAGLLHDGHEAYLQDDTTPKRQAVAVISQQADAAQVELRSRMDHAIFRAFGVATAARNGHADIKRADNIALATERRDLLAEQAVGWPRLAGVSAAAWLNLRDQDRFTWQDWARAFLDRIHELQFAIRLRSDEISAGQLGCEGSAA